MEYDSAGQPTRIRPDRDHPVTRGFVCAKGTRFLESARSPDRLLQPLWRDRPGAPSAAIGWSEALSRISERVQPMFKQYGPHSVALYLGNPIAFNSLGAIAMRALQQSLGSRNVFTAGSQDCNNKFSGSYIVHGSPLIHPLPDFARTEFVLLLGTNPVVSQSSFVHLEGGVQALDDILARGGEIVVVDPRRSESARRWGSHLPIRPGTDVFLLLALLHELAQSADLAQFDASLSTLRHLAQSYNPEVAADLTGIPATQIRALAEKLRTRRGTVHMSVGVNMGRFGTLSYVALQAVLALCGALGQRGGAMLHPLAQMLTRLMPGGGYGESGVRSRVGNYPAVLGSLPGGILADEILSPGEGQVRALICLAGDPLRSIPGGARLEQAMRSLELLVTIDNFESHTGKLAHLQLPALAWTERADVATTATMFQYAPYVQHTQPVMAGPAEARHDAAILADVSLALGRPLFGSARVARAMASIRDGRAMGSMLQGFSDLLARTGLVPEANLLRMPVPRPIKREDYKKLKFWHTWLEAEPARLALFATEVAAGRRSGEYLVLGRRRKLGHNGWLHGATRSGDEEAAVWIAAADARGLGLSADASHEVEIYNDTGVLRLPARIHDDVLPGTVVVPHGLPGANLNALIPSGPDAQTIEPISGMHQMQGIAVRLRLAA